jgi:transposase InsO family protein
MEKTDVLDFIKHLHDMTGLEKKWIIKTLGVKSSTYYNWFGRQEQCRLMDTKPVGRNPYRLLDWEKEAIVDFYMAHQENGYRRLTYMMIDQNIVYCSPSTVYRHLKGQGLLMRWAEPRILGPKPALPTAPNQKWHTDLMIMEIGGINYYYQGIIDAYSRYIISWDIHTEGTALNTSLLLQEAYDKSPDNINPVVIADNGPEFIGKEFREIIKVHQGKDVRITAYHPQSNGIEERFHRTLRCEGLDSYANIIEAKRKVGRWIEYYNKHRLHSAIDYMAPEVWHYGDPVDLKNERKMKLKQAKEERKLENLKLAS